jgi:exopolyphosphatase/guanosine-5'-triphosphate,3'-diphosphate pyrophosphatase
MDVVRLGQGVDRTGRLAPEAVDRTLAVIDEFARSINAHHVRRLRFVATSATRDASNRDLFIDGVRDRLGVAPEVISGTEEAELSFTGTVGTLPGPVPSPRLVVDIGGGSTELVLGEHHPTHRISLDVGSVRLTERFFASDPPSRAQREEAAAFVDDLLDAAEREVPLAQARTLVGVAGTVTTLTALYAGLTTYTPDVTHGLRVGIDEYRALCDRVLAMPRSERVDQPIIHPGRVDVIAAGALIWERVRPRP